MLPPVLPVDYLDIEANMLRQLPAWQAKGSARRLGEGRGRRRARLRLGQRRPKARGGGGGVSRRRTDGLSDGRTDVRNITAVKELRGLVAKRTITMG